MRITATEKKKNIFGSDSNLWGWVCCCSTNGRTVGSDTPNPQFESLFKRHVVQPDLELSVDLNMWNFLSIQKLSSLLKFNRLQHIWTSFYKLKTCTWFELESNQFKARLQTTKYGTITSLQNTNERPKNCNTIRFTVTFTYLLSIFLKYWTVVGAQLVERSLPTPEIRGLSPVRGREWPIFKL